MNNQNQNHSMSDPNIQLIFDQLAKDMLSNKKDLESIEHIDEQATFDIEEAEADYLSQLQRSDEILEVIAQQEDTELKEDYKEAKDMVD